jgi:small conductance mechanosensitive channel
MPDSNNASPDAEQSIETVNVIDAINGIKDVDASNIDKMIEFTKEWALSSGLDWAVSILSALLVFYIGRWVAHLLTNALTKIMATRGVDPSLVSFTRSLTNAALVTFVAIAALGQLGVQTTSFIAIIGAAGLAVGLALQGSLSNFAAGVLMIIFRPIKVGDFVEAADTAGIVEDIQIFSTTLRTPDNKTIIVPNSSVTGGNITNYSTKPTRRIDFEFGVAYDADLKQSREIFSKILEDDPRVLKDPASVIGVKELADSAVIFAVRPWVNAADYWDVFFDITEKTKIELDAANIGIPFPQMDVHMHKESAA